MSLISVYLIEYRLAGANKAPSNRALRLRHAHVKHLTSVLRVSIVSVNPVLTRKCVNDVLTNESRVIGQQQATGFRLLEDRESLMESLITS